jgi:hypothetical protein
MSNSKTRIFKTRWFNKWAIRERIADATLVEAINEIARGLVDANLGGNVYKKRIGISGRGKSGGARTIVACKVGDKAFFIYGYTKNERENLEPDELKGFKQMAVDLLAYTESQITEAVKTDWLKELVERKDG